MRGSSPAVFGVCFLVLLLAPSASAACQLTYLGCYVDSPDRLLPTQTADAFTCLTREYCASLCASVGAPVSGGEFAGQCFCGPSLPSSAVKVPDSECNMACSGDAHTTCGGSYRISVSSAVCTGPPQPSPCAYNVCPQPPALPLSFTPRCLTPGDVQVTDFCGRAAHGSWPVCDPSVPAAQRAADIIGRMSLPDKIAALGTDSPALPSVGLRPCATP